MKVHENHFRYKRSLKNTENNSPQSFNIEFFTHQKLFKLQLQRDFSVFHKDFHIVDQDGNQLNHIDTSNIYHGKLIGKRSSIYIQKLLY